MEEFLSLAASDPLFAIPYPVAASMLDDSDRPEEGFSVTELLSGCLSCKVLQRYEPYTEDIMDRWFRWRGTMFHRTIEGYVPPDCVSEVRFWADLPYGGVMSGKPDLIYPSGTLVDLKTTKRIPLYGPWPNHVEQLNAYRWLINHACRWEGDLPFDPRDLRFERLVVWYVDEGGVKPSEAKRSRQVATKSGAKNPTKTVRESAVYTDEEVEAQIVPRYEELSEACELYERSRCLPPYPPGFDLFGWEHQYSPTASLCVIRHYEEKSHA